MKRAAFFFIGFLFITINSHSQLLRVRGTAIVNDESDTVLLRGMGLGGWMLQEGYMFRLSNLGQQYRIKEKIVDVVGKEKADDFYDSWLEHHTTRADIDSLASWGFNSIRLPMHYNLYTLPVEEEPFEGKQTWVEKGFGMTDSLLEWCKANKMYLILDLHAAPGGQGNDLAISDRNPAKPSLWESEENKLKTIALWRKLAERYANEEWIGGYDIINEPNWGFENTDDKRGISESKNIPLRQLMEDITKAIREVDKNHIIIIEGNGFGNNYRGIFPAWDDNMVVSFHKYGNFNTPEQVKGFLEIRDKHNIPLWLGESGENSNTWFTEAIALVEQEGIGWAWWQEKKMGINNPLEIKRPKDYEVLLDYWSGKTAKPSHEQAWAILSELIENLKISNNIFHPDVVDAMIRQPSSVETKPYRDVTVGNGLTTISAVDFDMGRQRYAYYDTDTARYQYTPGVNTDGNRGHLYRNDGVDIRRIGEIYAVDANANGEWLQYTINTNEKGNFRVYLEVSSSTDSSAVSVLINGMMVASNFSFQKTLATEWKTFLISNISLEKGLNTVRIHISKAGFNLKSIQFEKVK